MRQYVTTSNCGETNQVKLDRFLEKLSRKVEISVGYLADKPSVYPGTNISVAEIAKLNERGGTGAEGNIIPPRPFLKNALKVNKSDIIESMLDAFEPENLGSKAYLETVGKKLKNMVQSSIDDGPWAPNARYTIEKKGSSKPLIDTGRMRRSVGYKVSVE